MANLKNRSAGILAGVCALALQAAYAQDTAQPAPDAATTNVGNINVEGAGQVLGSGYIVPEDGPKERSTVTAEGIGNLIPTVNPFEMIANLPGVNVMSEDALGLAGGTVRVRGLVASQMGFTINGAPFNDSGTFNVYPSEIIDSENVEQIWVTQGSTDIDAPHVGASGGNIGVVTRQPRDYFSIQADASGGDEALQREFLSIDTGLIGDFKGFASVSYTHADKWRGDGDFQRLHSDGHLTWQFLPGSSIGLTWLYNDSINYYYRDYASWGSYSNGIYNVYTNNQTAYQTFKEVGRDADYDTFWGTSSSYPINLKGPYSTGACSSHPNPACMVTNPDFPTLGSGSNNTNVTNYYALNLNPYRNAVVTIPVDIEITDNLRWETNGYLWWGVGGADFGGNIQEGSYYYGYKILPQYGDASSSTNEILTTEGTVNKTMRPGVTTKFVYDTDDFSIAAGGWMEHSRLVYNKPYSVVNANGTPCDEWMTSTANNSCLVTATDPTGQVGPAYASNFIANSIGESAFVEAQGRFLDDTLKVTMGVSGRELIRDVRNFLPICADDPGLLTNPGSSAACTTYDNAAFVGSSAYQYFNGPTVGAAAAYAAMRTFAAHPHLHYSELLPEFNVAYDIDPDQQVYAGLSTGFRAPNVTNLSQFQSSTSTSSTSKNFMEITDVKSEYAYSWEAGYRYHNDFVVSSATVYLQDVRNYQASEQLDPADFITSNIGGVKIYGLDFEAGTKPWHGFTFYGSAEIQNSVLSQYLAADYSGTTILYANTKGKQLVDTPNWIVSTSVGYSQDGYFADVSPHCQGTRATSLSNDEFIAANCIVDATMGYHFGAVFGDLHGATFKLYAVNLFNSKYFGEIYTQGQTNAKVAQAYTKTGTPIAGETIGAETYTGEPGAPVFVGAELSIDLGP
jgi:iron complex outermembrane recepter protein